MVKEARNGRKKTRRRQTTNGRKTAIILQGGASRGAHQAGAMQYLNEIGVKPDMIIGSSIGVINACLYASDGTEGMMEFWTSFKTQPLTGGLSLRENVIFGNSLLSMRKNFDVIEKFIDFRKVFRSKTEVSFILTNLSKGTGELRSNRTEDNVEDLRTISRIGYTIPGLFPPVKFHGDYWCDGGFVWNVPLEYALQRGAARIFMLLCIGRSLPRQEKFSNIYQVLTRFYDVMWVHVGCGGMVQRNFMDSMYKGREIHIIEPSTYLEGFGPMGLLHFHPDKAKRFIQEGYRDAREQMEKSAT